jgi:Ca2+-binding RTX toxin-like protein
MESIGEIVALRGTATAQGQDGVRELAVGSPVFSGDVLTTGENSNFEVRFTDDTVLAQGPGASLTVDEYVFDPAQPSASSMLMDLSTGTFRMVTGAIAKDNPDGIAISSPLATIGIRGTGADMEIRGDGSGRFGIFQYDGLDLVVTTARGTVFLTNQGLVVDMGADGSLGEPRPYTPEELQLFQTLAPLSVILDLGQGEQGGQDDGGNGDQQGGREGEGQGEGQGEGGETPPDPFDATPQDPFDTGEPEDSPTLAGAAGGFVSSSTPPPSGDQPSGGADDEDTVAGGAAGDGGDGGGDDDPHQPPDDGTIYGTEGNDTIEYFEDAAALVYALGGNDFVFGGPGNDTIYGGTGDDEIYGLDGNDSIDGGTGDDMLYGGEGNDSLSGNAGDDFLNGGLGSNYIDGGDGNDTVSFEDSPDALSSYSLNGTFGDTTVTNVENLYGSAYGDSLNGDGFDNLFMGKGGNDNISGNGGSDTLYGNDGNDTLYGNDGDDVLYGDDGNDYMLGGLGDDLLVGGDGEDTLYGGDGDDTVSFAGSDAGVIVALPNAGILSPTLVGGHAEGDKIQDIENVIGSDYNDTITGNTEANILVGGDGMDSLLGEGGNDSLVGGDGSDVLIGGAGNDTLAGGDGNDTFYWGSTGEVYDTIADFTAGTDELWFKNSAFGMGATVADLAADHFAIITSAYTGDGAGLTNPDPCFVAVETALGGNSYSYTLYYDSNGNVAGGETAIATITSEGQLSASDIHFDDASPIF